MSARSEGIFPREGFNLDQGFTVTTTPTDAPVNLGNVRTLRVIATEVVHQPPAGNATDGELTYTIGGRTYNFSGEEMMQSMGTNGAFIAHHRGYGSTDNKVSFNTIPGLPDGSDAGGSVSIGGMFIELVDGPAY